MQALMKALSIQQPWAWAILNAGKDIENRNWFCNFTGRILIHAGKKYDEYGHSWITDKYGIVIPQWIKSDRCGGIVGSVEIVNCVRSSTSTWFFGKFGFVLRNPIELPFMPLRGQLGLFNVEYKEAA